ncbi:hypothetical protein BKD26_14355 [Streptomyces sp. CB03238]|nr:hypothetical protein BKD26_14355 [Streptomyces sp. CB03238]
MLGQGTTHGEGQAMTLLITTGQSTRTPRMRCALAAEPVAARVARHLVSACFAGQLSASVIADVGLVITELVANAVTATGDSGSVEFGAWLDNGDVVLQVIDQADGEPKKSADDQDAETGRGLLLVQELTRDWGWTPVPGGKAVWGLISASSACSETSSATPC